MSVGTITPIQQQKVLIDHQGSIKMSLTEDKEGKRLFAEGKIGQCDVPTANGRVYTRAVMEREVARLQERINNASLLGAVDHPGDGKCLGIGTPVLMSDGRVLPVEQIVTGDKLIGPDGEIRNVLSTTKGRGPLFEITPTKGNRWVCNDKHILTVVNTDTNNIIDISIEDWNKASDFFRSRHKQFSVGIDTFSSWVDACPVDPYFLGVWFGDGTKALREYADGSKAVPYVEVTTADPEIVEVCETTAQAYNLRVNYGKPYGYSLIGKKKHKNPLLETIREIVRSEVTIPDCILHGDRQTRLSFLAGFLDTDGSLEHNCFYFTQKREDWAKAVWWIARSLGFSANLSTRKAKSQNGTEGSYFTFSISGNIDEIPTKIKRKIAQPRKQRKVATRVGFSVTSIGEGDYYGFELDGDGRFLLGDFTVSHNSRIMEAGHIVRKLWIERDGSVHGKFEIVEESDAGRNLAAFLRRGASIGMSSRGLGSTHQNESGQEVVGEDFKLASYDFVSDPAVSTAYPQFFTEDKDLAEKVTVDAIRAKFPHLVRQIEESAHEVAKDTTIEAVRSEMETEVEQALSASRDKLKEEIKLQVLPDILKEVRDDFGNKLVKALQGMRKEVEEAVTLRICI